MTTIELPEIDLSSKAYIYNPDSFFKCYRQHAPIFYLEKYHCWLISRHADVKQALNDPAFTRNINYSNNSNFAVSAKQWNEAGIGFFVDILTDENAAARNRNLITSAFRPKKIDSMSTIIESVVNHYCQRLKKGGIVDLAQDIISPIPCALIRKLLGIQLDTEEAEETFRLAAISIVPGLFNPYASPELRLKAINSSLYLRTLLLEEIAKRKENPQADLLTQFIQAIEAIPECNEMDVVKLVLILLFAATDTTVYSTFYAIKNLFEHPEQLAMLRADRSLMTNAMKELLRFHSAGSFFPKYAMKDVVYHGQTIKKGQAVFIAIASANKDERVFPQPDVLDITRDTDETLSFGYGRHYCLGTHLALTVMGAIFNRFLDDLPADARLMSEAIQWEENSGRCTIVYLPLDTQL
jgi:cytochrome P450